MSPGGTTQSMRKLELEILKLQELDNPIGEQHAEIIASKKSRLVDLLGIKAQVLWYDAFSELNANGCSIEVFL